MSTIRVYSLRDKQRALDCFAAGMNAKEVYKKLHFSYVTLKHWRHRFLLGDVSWAIADDEKYIERQKALALFQEGRGYKYVATALGVPTSRSKYWMHMFKNGQLNFFTEGSKRPKRYDDAFKEEVLRRFAELSGSKKAFAHQTGISVSILNMWLKEAAKKTNEEA